MSEIRWAMSLIALFVSVCSGAASAAGGEGPVIVSGTKLSVPSDSHEPQRALIDLENLAADRISNVTLTCIFTGESGMELETSTVAIASLDGRARRRRVTAFYYGWPRATHAECGVP